MLKIAFSVPGDGFNEHYKSMEDFNAEEVKSKLCTLIDQVAEFSKSEDCEKFKQAITGLEGKNFEDLTDEEKQPLVDLMNKIPESTLWMTFLLMMLNPFGLKKVNVPFQNIVSIDSIPGCGYIDDSGKNFYTTIPEACKNCSNHPSNGGSGNCNCILGGLNVTY